jgi:DNA primase catalytic core
MAGCAHMLSDIKGARASIRSKVDIIKVIIDDLGPPVKSTGRDSFWFCPIHNETNSPSFSAHITMQIFLCFGCQEKGDVVAWTQIHHGVSTHEALELLSERYGVDISEFQKPPTQEELVLARYQSICEEVANYCNSLLLNDKQRLDWYKSDTGFDLDKIVTYSIGYSNSTDNLTRHLFSKISGLTQDDIHKLELENRLLWNNSLIYPIRDHVGKVTKFYAKPLNPPPDFGGKYVGTSHNHPLFTHKILYGLDVIRKGVRKTRSVRVCEGFKAAIASGGVAVMGTQLHDAQIELLREHDVKEIRIAFDGDSAGQTASVRVLEYLDTIHGINVFIAQMPNGTQPDGIVKTLGKEALDTIFKSAVLPIQFFVDLRRDNTGQLSSVAKHTIVNELKTKLANISDISAEANARYLADTLGIDIEAIRTYIAEIKIAKGGLYNREAEECVIAHVLLNPKSWSVVKQQAPESRVFTVSACEKIFKAIDMAYLKAREVNNTAGVTPQSVKDELAILFPHMLDLSKAVDALIAREQKYDFNDALLRVMDLYRRRLGIEQSRTLSAMLQDLGRNTSDIVSSYRRKLVTSLEIRKNEAITPVELSDRVVKILEQRSLKKSSIVGYDFSVLKDVDGEKHPCLPCLSVSLSGLQDGHQVIISANSGVGKSLLGLQMAESISICPDPPDQVPALWIPLEMNADETGFRILSHLSGVNNTLIQSSMLTEEQSLRVTKAAEMYAKGQLYIRKPRTGTIDEIFSIVDEMVFKYGIKAVFLDYIQLIADGIQDRGASREQVIGRASKVMKNQIAEGIGIVSVCIAQQNRLNFRAGEPGKIESVGGSYQVSQDADDFMIIAEKTPEQMAESKDRGNRILLLDKRRGGTSDTKIDMDLDTSRHVNLRFTEKMPPEQVIGILGKI